MSLRIGSSRSHAVRGGGAGNRSEEARASGISAMQTYPARRAMYSQSTTAKYASVKKMTAAIMSREGASRMKTSGSESAVVAALKATMCASQVHVPTANPGPGRSREKVTAAESALKASPSRTAKMQASESNQFSAGHMMQINPANGRKRTKARPGLGLASGETKPTRLAAPTKASSAASVNATRKKLSPIRGRNERAFIASCD